MKNILGSFFLFTCISFYPPSHPNPHTPSRPLPVARNLFIITLDGFRWQEVFSGADSLLVSDESVTPDTATMKMLYWDPSAEERRKKLLPFFWNIIARKGQLYGNRVFDNKVNTSNHYAISYPGYNEIFTGATDNRIASNRKRNNPNINVLEYLDGMPVFRGKVAAFTSWDVFPYIFNAGRNDMAINSGYMPEENNPTFNQQLINKVQEEAVFDKTATRHDQLTFLTAQEYIQQHHPRVVYIGFGETDESAHRGRYDLYLEQANKADKMIGELWNWVQTTEGYRDNTTFIITTDHGRGSKSSKWSSHGEFIKGSSQTWIALLGPGINGAGEIKENLQVYQSQLAGTMAGILGVSFNLNNASAPFSLK